MNDDAAIRFFVDVLQFKLAEATPSLTNDGRPKRWAWFVPYAVVWHCDGSNADSLIAADGGVVLLATNDASNVMRLDPATGRASSSTTP